jgi:hypothetical protein
MTRPFNKDMVGVKPLLLGPPLCAKDDTSRLQCVDNHVEGVRSLLANVYGQRLPDELARVHADLQHVVDMPSTDDKGIACKRALVLTAMHLEREVADYFAQQEQTAVRIINERDGTASVGQSLAKDMKVRVVPFLLPMYVRGMCQNPEAFVTLATILAIMWAGEPLGSFVCPTS